MKIKLVLASGVAILCSAVLAKTPMDIPANPHQLMVLKAFRPLPSEVQRLEQNQHVRIDQAEFARFEAVETTGSGETRSADFLMSPLQAKVLDRQQHHSQHLYADFLMSPLQAKVLGLAPRKSVS